MQIRHERPMPNLAYEVAAPLRLDVPGAGEVAIARWSLDGLAYPEADGAPHAGVLVIPFQGVDIRFPVRLAPTETPGLLRFVDLSGRQRETLAVFYRSLLSGRMASTEDVITSLDTPVDLVPMGETEAEAAAATRGKAPRLLRAIWNLAVYAVLAVLVFGVMGGQVAALMDRIDVDRGRVIVPTLAHAAPAAGFVRELRVGPGDHVSAGDVLAVLGDPALDAAVAEARQAVDVAAWDTARAAEALDLILAAMGRRGGPAASATARHALAARLQTEFFADGDDDRLHRLWMTLRQSEPALAARYAPDAVIAERLEGHLNRRRAALAERREALALAEARRDAARVVALTDGTVLDLPVHPGQRLEAGSLVAQIEAHAPRLMLGWVSSEISDAVHLGQRVSVRLATEGDVLTVGGRVVGVRAGPDPGQPNAFGMLVSVAAELDTETLRATFPADAPVGLTIHRDRLAGAADRVADLLTWARERVL